MVGLVAALAVVGCIDPDDPPEDTRSGAESTAPGSSVGEPSGGGATSTTGGTTINYETDAGGEDYGGAEWDDTSDADTGSESGLTADPSTDSTGDETTGTTSSSTGGTGTGMTTQGNETTTDAGGEDYGGAPPAERGEPFPIGGPP